MTLWALLSCTKDPPSGKPPPGGGDTTELPDSGTTGPDSGTTEPDCALPLLSGGLDTDCNGTAAQTVPLAQARSLEIIGTHWSELGTSLACSEEAVGIFPTA